MYSRGILNCGRVFGKIDPEEQPARYAAFVAKVLEQALREEADPDKRLASATKSSVKSPKNRGEAISASTVSFPSRSPFS